MSPAVFRRHPCRCRSHTSLRCQGKGEGAIFIEGKYDLEKRGVISIIYGRFLIWLISVTVVEYTFWEAVCGASRVMLHANAVIFYYLLFDSVNNNSISTAQHFALIFSIALLLYLVFLYMIRPGIQILCDHFYTFITLLCFGYALTPIIRFLSLFGMVVFSWTRPLSFLG